MSDQVKFEIVVSANNAVKALNKFDTAVKRAVKNSTAALSKLDKSMDKITSNMRTMNSMKMTGFATGLKNANKQADLLEKKMRKINSQSQGGGGGRRGGGGMGGRMMNGAMGMLGGLGAYSLLGAVGSSVTSAIDFEYAMKQVKQLTKGGDGNYDDLENKVRDTAKGSIFSMTEVAGATKYLAMAGMEMKNIEGSIGTVTSLATATGEDIELTADKITNLSTAFGITDFEGLGDAIAGTLNNANIKMQGFSTAMEYSGAIAAQSGIGFVDLSTAIGVLADSGYQASKIGTSLRTIITNLKAPTTAGLKVIDKFKLSIYETVDGVKKMKSVDKIMSQLTGASDSDMKSLFGKTAIAQATSLVASQRDGSYKKKYKTINESRGSVNDMEAGMMDTTQGRIALLKSSWSSFTEKAFSAAAPAVSAGLVSLTSFIDKISDSSSGLGTFFSDVGGKIEGVVGLFTKLGTGITDLFSSESGKGFISNLSKGFDNIVSGIAVVMSKFGELNQYLKSSTGKGVGEWLLSASNAVLDPIVNDESIREKTLRREKEAREDKAKYRYERDADGEGWHKVEKDASPISRLLVRGALDVAKWAKGVDGKSVVGKIEKMFPNMDKGLLDTIKQLKPVINSGTKITESGDAVGTLASSSPLSSVANEFSRSIVVNMDNLVGEIIFNGDGNDMLNENGDKLSDRVSELLLHIVQDYELGMSN